MRPSFGKAEVSKPTGGEWRVALHAYNDHWRGDGTEVLSDYGRIAETSVNGLRDPDECRANARLIAAAPDLLRRFVAWSEARDAHAARGYVLHDEHQRVVLSLDQERCRIVAEAKALLGSGSGEANGP